MVSGCGQSGRATATFSLATQMQKKNNNNSTGVFLVVLKVDTGSDLNTRMIHFSKLSVLEAVRNGKYGIIGI